MSTILRTLAALLLVVAATPAPASAQGATYHRTLGDAAAGQQLWSDAAIHWTNAYQAAMRSGDWAELGGLAERMLFIGDEDLATRWFHDAF